MKRLICSGLFLLAPLLLAMMLGCSSEPDRSLEDIILLPPPTATSEPSSAPTVPPTDRPASSPVAETATPAPTDQAATLPPPAEPLNASDLEHLPDDPTELMFATIDTSLADVGRKMAYSHNEEFIPVILEFMRFQTDEEALLTLASFIVRIRDKIPEGEFAIVPYGQSDWDWWVKWLAENPQIQGPEGYDAWKGQLFSIIDPPMGEFMYADVPTSIRLEEIVWGGVRRDGIPDLRFPPFISPEDARYLDPGDRVFGVSINGEHRAYPLKVLNPHEMANDILGGVQFALAY